MHRKRAKKGTNFRDSASFQDDYKELKKLYSNFKQKYKLKPEELISKLEEKEILLPTCIFLNDLSILESIVKYLKENINLPNKEIAKLTFKSQKSIWQSYNSSKRKFPSDLKISPSKYYIPISALKKQHTTFESIIKFLKDDLNLGFSEIANLLKRDPRTIWTVYHRK